MVNVRDDLPIYSKKQKYHMDLARETDRMRNMIISKNNEQGGYKDGKRTR